MKTLLMTFATLFILISCQKEVTPPLEPQASATNTASELPSELEDCDDKIKKLEEKKTEEVVSLGDNPDAGCSVE